MKKLKIILSLTVSLLILLSFVACSVNDAPPDGGGGSESEIGSDSESESAEDIKTSPYVIIVPENVGSAVYSAAYMLQSAIRTQLGYEIEIKDDYLSWADTEGEYEILIGDVKRDEAEAVSGLLYNDYSISTSSKKWIIKGGCDNSVAAAVSYFSANCLDILEECPADYSYHSEATYKVKTMTICGKDVSEYIMVYPNNDQSCEKYAVRIQTKIAALCGTVIPVYKMSDAPRNKPKITFGNMAGSICSFSDLGYDSYEIAAEEGIVSFAGGCQNAYYTVLEKFEKNLKATETLTLTAEAIRARFDQVSRSEYIENADLFVPIWKRTYTAGNIPTLEEKIATLNSPKTETLITMAHRGEHEYYPENSVEALISAYHAGVYIVELDAYYTADGVLVVMHDSTVSRTTNFDSLKGATVDGVTLPTSNKISDWTYEQLSKLSLKCGSYITEFKIATLEDILRASKDKMLITVENKTDSESFLEDIYSLMKKTGNYRSFLIGTSGGMSKEDCVEWQTRIKSETGVSPVIVARSGFSAFQTTANYLKSNAVGEYAILLGAYKVKDNASLKVAMGNVVDSINIGGWTLSGDGDAPSTAESWQEMYDLGFRMIMADNIFDLLKFAKNLA